MATLPPHLTAEQWLNQFFTSGAARRGGIVKRKTRDIERLVGRTPFLRAVSARGFRAYENGHHIVVVCNDWPIRQLR